MWNMILAICIVVGVPFLLTFFTYKDKEKVEKNQVQTKQEVKSFEKEIIVSPIEGETVLLQNANDISFKEGKMGNGIAVNPSVGEVYAPVSYTHLDVYKRQAKWFEDQDVLK